MEPQNNNTLDQMDSYFRRSYSYLFARTDLVSTFSYLFALRGFWPVIPLGATADATDFSNNNRTLTAVGSPIYYNSGLQKFVVLTRGVPDYFTRADEAEFDITGTETWIHQNRRGLTMGGWFKFSTVAGATETLMSKWDAAGGQTSYLLQRDPAGTISFFINAAGNVVTSVVVPVTYDWYFIVATYKADPVGIFGGELHLYINDEDYQSVTGVGVPVSITNSTAPFQIGAANAVNPLSAYVGPTFVSASYYNRTQVLTPYEISKALFPP